MSSQRRPSHRLCLQPDAEQNYTIEVGALWPHEKGGGYSVTIKRGLALHMVEGARLVAFTITDEDRQGRDDDRDRADDRRQSQRSNPNARGGRNGAR